MENVNLPIILQIKRGSKFESTGLHVLS